MGAIGEQELGFGVDGRWCRQDGVVSGGVQAQDDFGAGGLFETQPLGANRDPPVGPDLDGGTDAPDVVPPRAAGSGAQDGTLFAVGLPPRLLWRLAQFAMDRQLRDL